MDFRGFYDNIIFDVDSPVLKSYNAKQGDTKSRGIYVTVTQRNVVIKDLAGLRMRLFYEKPDKTRGYIDGVVDGDKFRIDYTNQMFAVPGVVKAELRLTGANGEIIGEIITGKTFKILVDSSIADGSIISKDERGILDRAFELSEDILPRLELLDVELLEDVQAEMLEARHSHTKNVTYDSLGQRLDTTEAEVENNRQQDQLKIAKVEKELNDYKKVMSQVNINHEAKQSASGYGTISLPPNTANGQVSVTVKGRTWNNRAGAGDTSPQTIENLDSTKTYLLIKTDGGTVNVDGDDINVPAKITGKTSITLTWASGKIALYELSTEEAALTEAELGARYHYVDGTKSTVSASRLKSVGVNLFDKNYPHIYSYYHTKASIDGRNVLKSSAGTNIQKLDLGVKFKSNTQYTISLEMKPVDPTSGWGTSIFFVHTDGTMSTHIRPQYDATTWEYKTTFSISGKTVEYIGVRSANGRDGDKYATYFDLDSLQIEEGAVATPYEPYKESTAYVIAKDKDNKIVNLTTVKDTTGNIVSQDRIITKENGEMECILENKSISNVATSTVINYTDMKDGGYFNAYGANGEYQVGVKGDTLTFTATKLIYQLAEPEIIPIQVSGNIVSYPNGTIYIEPAVADANVYNDGIIIFEQELNIDYIDKIAKVDYVTGVEIPLDASKAVISEDKKSFTHPDLMNGDMVFFSYFYSNESTQGEATVEYYDSRYVIKDKSLDKFYQWDIEVDNGVPSIKLVEV